LLQKVPRNRENRKDGLSEAVILLCCVINNGTVKKSVPRSPY